MLNFNQSIIAGIMGGEIDVRYTDNGSPYCRFVVGTTDEEVDEEGNTKQITEWHRCFVQGETAVKLESESLKGASVYIVGKTKTKFFDDEAGLKRQITELWVDEAQVISGGKKTSVDLDEVLRDALDEKMEDIPY